VVSGADPSAHVVRGSVERDTSCVVRIGPCSKTRYVATVARPSLDDVYLRYAGRHCSEAGTEGEPAVAGGAR